jgi:hypothetical protein
MRHDSGILLVLCSRKGNAGRRFLHARIPALPLTSPLHSGMLLLCVSRRELPLFDSFPRPIEDPERSTVYRLLAKSVPATLLFDFVRNNPVLSAADLVF